MYKYVMKNDEKVVSIMKIYELALVNKNHRLYMDVCILYIILYI